MFPTKGNTRPVSTGAGFTLLELMVGVSLSFTIVAATLAAYTYIGRNFTRMSNTQRLEALSRRAFTVLSKDVRQATQIDSANSSTTQLTLVLPTKTVSYTYTMANGTEYNRGMLVRSASPAVDPEDYSTTLLTGIDTTVTSPLQFKYFDTSGNSTTTMASAKEIELTFVSAYTSAKQGSTDNLKKSTYSAVSSRVALSNRSFLQ
jgi:Tfp pilus assembly protein PilW